ncbi:MAG: asparaginase [Geminicoccaceae bacterium]|nr:asparaginase [Geminicoccaceae bacterium]
MPIAVEVCRGAHVESRHAVSAVVVDASGTILAQAGDIGQAVFPRSAIKPFQAIPLIETGAAERFAVSREELALACASHGGEPMHVERVAAWLARLGMDDERLGCGPHRPTHLPSADALVRAGERPRRLHNNCSGKHTGMLAVALHMSEDPDTYLQVDHPVQRRVRAVLDRYTGDRVVDPPGTDGCGVPSWPIPLQGLALAVARFGADEAPAAVALRRAMTAHPELVAGSGRCCTAVMRAAPHILAKTGAEGVFVAAVPERRIGLALKATDGATRAAEVTLLAIFERLGLLDDRAREALAPFARPVLRNFAGTEVGEVRPAADWLAMTGR